jgi:Flp pilus assembly protein TadG
MVTNFKQKQKYFNEQAQAIVEFAIVLPILMAMLVGILETGRMVFFYAAVNNASREAVRYASAFGLNDTQTAVKYKDCAGIKQRAVRSAFFTNLTITITYDHGPGLSPYDTCDGNIDTAVSVNSGTYSSDRVNVSVSATYRPMVRLIPFGQHTFTSRSSRTVLGIVELAYP